jgi:hypothetical protein
MVSSSLNKQYSKVEIETGVLQIFDAKKSCQKAA